MTRITIEQLHKRFDKQTVLQDLNLVIEAGTFFTLLGPSGCGKTTLLRCLAGFNVPDGGHIRFDGDDITGMPAWERNIGMVFQDYALFPDKTVFDNVAYGLRARKLPRAQVDERAHEALQQVGLGALAERFPAQLSGGQRQRVALARAVVIKPRLLLMDEPLSNLDAKLRLAMRDMILDLQRATRITTVFVTHDQEEALALSDQIAVMQGGRVAQQGAPQQLYSMPESAFVADFIGSANLLPVTITGSGQVQLGPQSLQVETGSLPARAAGLLVLRPEALRLQRTASDPRARTDPTAPAAPAAAAASDHAPRTTAPLLDAARNGLRARVLGRQYLGPKTNYRLALDDGSELRVEDAGAVAFATGEQVLLQVPLNSRVVPA